MLSLGQLGGSVEDKLTQGRRHGFESGGGTILRVERAKNFFWTPHFLASVGDKILLR